MERPTTGIAVDCGCLGNPGRAEYRGIDLSTGKVIFQVHIKGLCTNNIAEFAALVHGVFYLKESNIHGKVWSDSKTALAWYKSSNPKSKLIVNTNTIFAHKLLSSCVKMIPYRDRHIYVDFWNNKAFGETPADYNRK